MSYKVLLPQPILPEGYEYLRQHGMRLWMEEDLQSRISLKIYGIAML